MKCCQTFVESISHVNAKCMTNSKAVESLETLNTPIKRIHVCYLYFFIVRSNKKNKNILMVLHANSHTCTHNRKTH